MRVFSRALLLTAAAVFATGALAAAAPAKGPRTKDGKPDLNGIWQSLTTANWDILTHAAQPGPHPELMGAWGAGPGGQGIVEYPLNKIVV